MNTWKVQIASAMILLCLTHAFQIPSPWGTTGKCLGLSNCLQLIGTHDLIYVNNVPGAHLYPFLVDIKAHWFSPKLFACMLPFLPSQCLPALPLWSPGLKFCPQNLKEWDVAILTTWPKPLNPIPQRFNFLPTHCFSLIGTRVKAPVQMGTQTHDSIVGS